MMFIASRTVPTEYSLVESGIVLLQWNLSLEHELVLETIGVLRGRVSNTLTDQFYVRKLNIMPGDRWYARAYLIYQDADGNVITVYSDNTVSQIMEE